MIEVAPGRVRATVGTASLTDTVVRLARAAAIPAALLLCALALRTYRLAIHASMPDTWEQLHATQRLLAGDFPLSQYYPAGVAITMAPAMLVLPQTFATMQAVIIAFSLVLVMVGYFGVRSATGDATAARLYGTALAVAPIMVGLSRGCLFDIIGVTYMLAALLLVPHMHRRGWLAAIAYGVLLSIMINVRVTNAVLLPALLIYWAGTWDGRMRRPSALRVLLRPQIVIAGSVMLALSVVYTLAGGWFGRAASDAPITLRDAAGHVGYYTVQEFGGPLPMLVLLPLSALGAAHLWRRNRALLLAAAWVVVVWPIAYAPLEFQNIRYMTMPLAIHLLFAAHSWAAIAHITRAAAPRTRLLARSGVVSLITLLGIVFAAADAMILYQWPQWARESDEGAMRELRPAVAALPADALLVSAINRGFDRGRNPSVEYFDLMDHSLPTRNTPEAVDVAVDRMEVALGDGRPVYYLYTRFESEQDNLGSGGPGFDAYFDEAEARFNTVLVLQTAVPEYRLYQVIAR